MGVDLTTRYSDDRLCEVLVSRLHDGEALYRIVTVPAGLGDRLAEAMREARRLFPDDPWSNRRRHADE
jgi:hypothetical protein